MPFDPDKPVEGTLCDAVEMRAQLTALYDLIPKAATLNGVATLPPGSSAGATVSLDSDGTLHFSFDIPQRIPGEVTTLQLNDTVTSATAAAMSTALAASSNKSNAVAGLGISPDDSDLSMVAAKLNELTQALRR
jgi:hypothetical protein